MTLPRFFARTAAAIDLVTTDGAVGARDLLQNAHATISLHNDDEPGFLISVNLAARLFPAVQLVADDPALTTGAELARSINPAIEFGPPAPGAVTVTIRHGADTGPDNRGGGTIDVRADGWNVHVDQPDISDVRPHPAASMMAGTLGVAEAFRYVFADVLPHPRTGPIPTGWNLLDLHSPHDRAPVDTQVDLGTVHLAGAGAVGQAAVATLAAWPQLSGTIVPVDPDTVDLSNLQRYLLTDDTSVDSAKTDIVTTALADTGLTVDPQPVRWNASHAEQAPTVMVALDSAEDRIAVQAGLPGTIYNAYTGRHDLGWSRHERLGTDPCLTCLYLPTGPTPSRTAQVADALEEPETRVALYYAHDIPIGQPLPRPAVPNGNADWAERSILNDVAERHGLPEPDVVAHAHTHIDRFYTGAVCGGALLPLPRERAAVLPLPHASAAAGIMLAVQTIVAAAPTLRPHRSASIGARLDLLTRPTPYPSQSGVARECICGDPDYRDAHDSIWSATAKDAVPEDR